MESNNTTNNNWHKLDVLICTFGEAGIKRVAEMRLPVVSQVRYIVSWQTANADPTAIPVELLREDILIAPTESIGSSNNRNHAISIATAPYCLTADDDLVYTSDQLLTVIETLDNNPTVDVALFQFDGENDKYYPKHEVNLTDNWPKGYYIASVEIAFRRESIAGKIFFNPYFGINSPRLQCGDDSVFVYDCRQKKLNCRFFPKTITYHAGVSSGNLPINTERLAMTHGAYIRYAYGWKGLPRVPLFVWRNYKKGKIKLIWGLRQVMKGFFYNVPKGVKEII